MRSITIELPEDLAQAIDTPEGLQRLREMIEAEFAAPVRLPLDPEMLDRGKRGAVDLAAGRLMDLEESRAQAQAALTRRAPGVEAPRRAESESKEQRCPS